MNYIVFDGAAHLVIFKGLPQQAAPLVFEGTGWLALMRDGKPVAIARAKAFMPDANWVPDGGDLLNWSDRDYWKPITEQTAATYRCTLPEVSV